MLTMDVRQTPTGALWLRRIGWAVAALIGGALLIVLAWVGSNWNDIEPLPRPAELSLPTPKVSDERNAFFTLLGLSAAGERDPAQAGREAWAADLAAAAARAQRPAAAVMAPTATAPIADSQRLPLPTGAPLFCGAGTGATLASDDCTGVWIEQAQALRAQREKYAPWGQRCERLAAADASFEERLPALLSAAGPIATHASAAALCSRWLLAGAVLAWAEGRSEAALAQLGQAQRFSRALLAGSHSLIAQMVALRVQRNTLTAITALALRDPHLAAPLAALITALPDQAEVARRWIAVEAAFQRGVLDELDAQCPHPAGSPVSDDQGPLNRVFEGASNWLMCHRIGWHPQRMRAATDAAWQHTYLALHAGVPAAIRQLADENRQQLEQQARRFTFGPMPLSWRNTFGEMVLAIGRSSYDGYLSRHADLGLHQEEAALALATQAAQVPAADRATWLAGQRLSDEARARLSFSADGLTLTARTWAEDRAAPDKVAERGAIRIRWTGAPDAPITPK